MSPIENQFNLNIQKNIRLVISHVIHFDLTIGSEERGIEEFTDVQIHDFMERNKKNIDECMNKIFEEFHQDGSLDSFDIYIPNDFLLIQENCSDIAYLFSYVREYLYDFVKF
jgi:hypothetical protein